ncbi:MAG: CotH kinase family protein [Verrucomicrobiae bacterium]|nr:CotH kinase family protein [Verrucomicrobiae bacterium]
MTGLILATSASGQGPSGFRIVDSQLVGADEVVISADIPPQESTYVLEFSTDPESVEWRPVYDSLREANEEDRRLQFRSRSASTHSGYYRIAQWRGEWQPVVLNEVMPNNTSTLADEDGEFGDWVELYNHGTADVDLSGFGLSDNMSVPLKWTFSGTTIPAGGYLVVFLSGKDRAGDDTTGPHTNFRMSNGREPVVLSNPAGIIIDRISPGPLASNDSLGRNVDHPLDWHEFDGTPAATPGAPNIPNSGSLPAPYVQPPAFATAAGFYDGPVEVTVGASHPGDLVYYTLDGSDPDTTTSAIADGRIIISQTSVLRAVSVGVDGSESDAATGTYFIGVDHTLPVLSIAANPAEFEFRNGALYGFGDSLFSRTGRIIGTFPWSNSNAWKNREIDANIEMFEDDKSEAFNEVLGLKVFGGWGSRGYAQKSLAVFARSRRGTGRIQHQLFPDKEVTSFESFVLRNSGNDNQSTYLTAPRSPIREFSTPQSYGSYFVNSNFTLFRDAMLTSLSRDIGLDTQGYRPSVVYINGDYWGIYNIREKLSEHYVESNHGVRENQVDMIEGYGSANAGSASEYNKMRTYISGRNMSDPTNYHFVEDHYLHIDNFIDYHLSVIFFQNFDIGNIKCWRPRIDGGKFRWIVYDQDYGFNLWPAEVYLPAMKRDYADYDNMFDFYTNAAGSGTGWPNAGGHTVLLRKMLDNEEFKARFILRCADLLNSTFSTDYVTARIDAMAAPIREEIPRHLARWNWTGIQQRGYDHPYKEEDVPLTQELWESHVQGMRDYAVERPAKLRNDLISHFKLEKGTGKLRISVTPADSGTVLVNSITASGDEATPWSGTYFEEFPPTLLPLPRPGWALSSWSGDVIDGDSATVADILSGEVATVTATFQPAVVDPANATAKITEIHYHPADRQPGGEWIEIWNSGNVALDISGWKIYDQSDDNLFAVPKATTLPAGARMVFAADLEAFSVAYPEVTNVAGGFDFGLGNSGDTVRLVDAAGAIVEAVTYDDKAPWPTSADGEGYSLSRVMPLGSPEAPTSWEASPLIGGSPGN